MRSPRPHGRDSQPAPRSAQDADEATGHRGAGAGPDVATRSVVARAGRPGDRLHDLRDIPLRQRHPADAAVPDAVPVRRLSLAAVLATDRAVLAAQLDQSGPLDPVDPARLPGDLLLLPEGVLPLLLRRSARLRGGGAHGPQALQP